MANILVATYDPKQVVTAWGTLIVSGFSDGTFIKISRNGALFEKKRGADGTVERVNKNAFDFTVTCNLQQTAATNLTLSAAAAADQLSNTGVLNLTIKDLLGATLFEAPQAWISKDPEDEFSTDLTGREWTFETGPAGKLTGGN